MPLSVALKQFATDVFRKFIKDITNRRIYGGCHEALVLAGQKMKEEKLV